jgi:hypothetical protein
MKAKHLFLVAAAGMFTLTAGSAMAFHGGGVAHCDGCHSMHNSPENPIGDNASTNQALLKGTDASSTCLNCHLGSAGSYHIMSTNGGTMSNGGDFFWLDNEYTVSGRTTTNHAGDNAGHNIVAVDFGLTPDGTLNEAPGGTYDASLLGCTSCHDAHGQVLGGTAGGQDPIGASGSYAPDPPAGTMKGNYRLLGDSEYTAGQKGVDDFDFTADAPIALANGPNGYQVRYGSGMSEWCANCHTEYLVTDPDSSLGKHPTSVTLSKDGYDVNYNSYVATGDFNGDVSTAFDPLVPIETGSADQATLITAGVTSTVGADANSQVMCLSCHRAHASAFNNMGRWDFETDVLSKSSSILSADIPSTGIAYYADGVAVDVISKYGVSQRSLCNKCHVQD